MTKINLNVPCILSDGKPQEIVDRTGRYITGSVKTLASHLADLIGTETKGRTLKLFGWYMKLQAGDVLELDDADLTDLKKLVEETDRQPVFIKGQILIKIKEAEDEEKEPKKSKSKAGK